MVISGVASASRVDSSGDGRTRTLSTPLRMLRMQVLQSVYWNSTESNTFEDLNIRDLNRGGTLESLFVAAVATQALLSSSTLHLPPIRSFR
ncbi:hypothetical protein F2Q68_00037574 [Brassica cretica]|uniref:Uncharacterized protein n=1 Tax=Brassica cretica TaxID=69181 RepID=A0A8S9GYY9_BRACR|nr:hypothetical protein F2Q68_00037574 [Brassica cretica]